jgi:hypothetical protein
MPLRALPVRKPPTPPPKSNPGFEIDDTAPTRIDPPPAPFRTPPTEILIKRIGPAWARGLAGKHDRDVAAAARALEAELHARIEMRRRREGSYPPAGEVREMVSDLSRVERHADDQKELSFLYVFWHAFKARLDVHSSSTRFAVLAQHAEKMMRETSRALGKLKRHNLADALVVIDDESRLPCVRIAAALAAARLFDLADVFVSIARRDEAAIDRALDRRAEEVLFEPIGWNASTTYIIVLPLPGPKGFALRVTLDGSLQITLTHGGRLDVDLLASNTVTGEHTRKLIAGHPILNTLRETARRAPDVGRLVRSLTAMEETLEAEPSRRPNAIAAVRKLCNEIYTWPELIHDLAWGPHPSFRALLHRAMEIVALAPDEDESVQAMRERLIRAAATT